MKLLLVAKPWRGGLAEYVLNAMRALGAANVRFIPTYPRTLTERAAYQRDKKSWRWNQVKKINAGQYDAAIFINHLSMLADLKHAERNVLWLTDGPRLNAQELQPFGRIYLSDPGYESELPAGVNYLGEMPFAHDPSVHAQYPAVLPKRPLCFIANRDAKRDGWLAPLLGKDRMPTVYGNYFMRHAFFWQHPLSFRPPVPLNAMGAVYARHRAALNIHAAVVREGTNMRTFECAGYGIPQLVEHRPGLERFFEPEHELLTFASLDEYTAQYDRLLGDHTLAKRLSQSAQKRVLAEHTYRHRVRAMLQGLIT